MKNMFIAILILTILTGCSYQHKEIQKDEIALLATQSKSNISIATPNYGISEETNTNKDDVIDEENNPITRYFKEHSLSSSSTAAINRAEEISMELWRIEMIHAYEVLIDKAHKDIKDSIIKSRDLILEYAKNEADVYGAVYASDGFGDESGKLHDSIGYGSGVPAFICMKKSEIFRNRTLDIYKYFASLGIETTFVFNEKSSISDEDKLLFQ